MAIDWAISGDAVLGRSTSIQQSDPQRQTVQVVRGSAGLGLAGVDDPGRDLQRVLTV